MRKIFYIGLLFLFTGHLVAAGIPAKITYQGTLRKAGVPTTGPTTLTFNIYKDADTSVAPIWSTKINNVPVNQGLFSVLLSPTGIDWQNVTPYIAVGVGDPPQMLGPAEPLTATVYATMAGSVVDGAVTTSKLDTSVQNSLIPKGAILMFDKDCPATWTRYDKLDNAFPFGGLAFGLTGGATSYIHTHGISSDGTHDHYLKSVGQSNYDCNGSQIGGGGPGGGYLFLPGNLNGSCKMEVTQNNTNSSGSHSHGGHTANTEVSAMPPYLTVIWCQKD